MPDEEMVSFQIHFWRHTTETDKKKFRKAEISTIIKFILQKYFVEVSAFFELQPDSETNGVEHSITF